MAIMAGLVVWVLAISSLKVSLGQEPTTTPPDPITEICEQAEVRNYDHIIRSKLRAVTQTRILLNLH